VSKRLLFGRFLQFLSMDKNAEIPGKNLTERRLVSFVLGAGAGLRRQRAAAVADCPDGAPAACSQSNSMLRYRGGSQVAWLLPIAAATASFSENGEYHARLLQAER
jgi:hypothetical protein